MPYKPTEYPLKGKGKYYYILYDNLEMTRSGKKVWKPRAKRVFISGELIRTEKGSWDVVDVQLKNGDVRNVYSFQLDKPIKKPKNWK